MELTILSQGPGTQPAALLMRGFTHGISSCTSMWLWWDSTCSILPQGFLTLIKHNFHRKQYFLESIRNLVTNSYKLCIELLFGYFKQIFILM